MGVADEVIAALSGSGAAVARMEIARLLNAAVLHLSARNRPARELALVAAAAAHSDEQLAAEMDRIGPKGEANTVRQLNAALNYPDKDPEEQAATADLRSQAEKVRQAVVGYRTEISGGQVGQIVHNNAGQVIQNTGSGSIFAPFRPGAKFTDDHAEGND